MTLPPGKFRGRPIGTARATPVERRAPAKVPTPRRKFPGTSMARVGLVGKPVPFRRQHRRSVRQAPQQEELHHE